MDSLTLLIVIAAVFGVVGALSKKRAAPARPKAAGTFAELASRMAPVREPEWTEGAASQEGEGSVGHVHGYARPERIEAETVEPRPARPRMDARQLRQAVVLSEILGKPVSQRRRP